MEKLTWNIILEIFTQFQGKLLFAKFRIDSILFLSEILSKFKEWIGRCLSRKKDAGSSKEFSFWNLLKILPNWILGHDDNDE